MKTYTIIINIELLEVPMKRIVSLCLVVILTVALFTGCGSTLGEKSPYDPALLTKQDGYTIATEFSTYPKDTRKINLLIKNDSDNEYAYGYGYSIEMKNGDEWYVVPLKKEVAFEDIGIVLPARTTATYELTLENFKSSPKAGKYRVVFNQNYIAEFEIV